MTDAERKTLLTKLKAYAKEAKTMPSEEAKRRLMEEGYYDKHGRLRKEYGGKLAARG